MRRDGLRARVNVTIDARDAVTGALLARERQHNLVVAAGLNLIRDLLHGDAVDGVTHFAVGTGATAAQSTDTQLETEVFRDALLTKAKDAGKLTCTYYLAAASANGNTLTEAGLLNASSTGTLYARVVLASAIVKTASIAVTFAWDLTWSV